MSLPFVKAALAGTLVSMSIAAMAVPSAIRLGEQFFAQDWAAACDNISACQAMSLLPKGDGERAPAIIIERADGIDGKLAVRMSLVEPKGDRYRISVDGRVIDTGMLAKGEWAVRVEGNDALKLARAIGRGRKLTVDGADGKPLGELVLNGSAAALAHIDGVQKRTGTRTALFASGRRALRARPAALPVIRAQRIGDQEMVPDTTAILGLVERSSCSDARVGVTEDAAYSLGRQDGNYHALVMISCGSGTENILAAPFIGTSPDGKQWTFAPARFDFLDNIAQASIAKVPGEGLLINYSWDAANQQLSSYSKGRGSGDCGSAQTYVWDGTSFRLVLAYAMSECRGATEWMTLWRAKVEFAG